MKKVDKYFDAEDDEVLSEELLVFARKYHEEDFQNLRRAGCPPMTDLVKVVDSNNLPDDSLRLHLLNCSPCHQEFRKAKSKEVLTPNIIENNNISGVTWSNFLRPYLTFAALILLICGVAGGSLYLWKQSFTTEFAESSQAEDKRNDTEESTNEVDNETTNQPIDVNKPIKDLSSSMSNRIESLQNTAKRSENLKKAQISTNTAPKYIAKNITNLDLSKGAVLRNKDSREAIHPLYSKIVDVNIKLPKNSPSGNYEVFLLDEFGNPLIKSFTKRSKGKNLVVNLDLRKKSGRARLCVAPIGEVPDCLPVNIDAAP